MCDPRSTRTIKSHTYICRFTVFTKHSSWDALVSFLSFSAIQSLQFESSSMINHVQIFFIMFFNDLHTISPCSPSVPFLPGTPLIPGVPDGPLIPVFPGRPVIPGIPAFPGTPLAPGLPLGPSAPGSPSFPSLPAAVKICWV